MLGGAPDWTEDNGDRISRRFRFCIKKTQVRPLRQKRNSDLHDHILSRRGLIQVLLAHCSMQSSAILLCFKGRRLRRRSEVNADGEMISRETGCKHFPALSPRWMWLKRSQFLTLWDISHFVSSVSETGLRVDFLLFSHRKALKASVT